jgi:hypothetical protein
MQFEAQSSTRNKPYISNSLDVVENYADGLNQRRFSNQAMPIF